MNYRGWLGIKDHERARPYDPAATRNFNEHRAAVERAEAAAIEAARKKREAKKAGRS